MIDKACKIPLNFDSYEGCMQNLVTEFGDLKHILLFLTHNGVSFNFSNYLRYCYKKANLDEVNILLNTVKFVRDHDCYFHRDWWSYVDDLRADLYTSLVGDLASLGFKGVGEIRDFLLQVMNQDGSNKLLNFEYKWKDLDEIYLLDDLVINLLLIEFRLNLSGVNSTAFISDIMAGSQSILLDDTIGADLMESFFKWLDGEQAMIMYANEIKIMVNHNGDLIL